VKKGSFMNDEEVIWMHEDDRKNIFLEVERTLKMLNSASKCLKITL
jgi:hypothetical protein